MFNKLKAIASALFLGVVGETAMALETIEYNTSANKYEGYLVMPSQQGELDGVSVLLAHDFLGPGENQLSIARELAAEGATTFVADFYGKNIRPTTPEDATQEAIQVRQNVPELRNAMKAALTELKKAGAKIEKTAVIGTSVGGLAALELARSEEKLPVVISLWGILENTQPDTAKPIKASVTLLQGDSDPLTPQSAITSATSLLDSDNTNYELVLYQDTAHAFTLPFVGTDLNSGFAYNEKPALDAKERIFSILKSLGQR